MFIKVTCSCGSRDVMHFKQNGTRLDQYCQCGNNLTAPQIRKQVRTRRLNASKTRHKPRRASNTYAIGLVLWAIFSVVAYGATAYAEMSTEIVYVAEVATSTPVEIVKPVEKVETIHEKVDHYADKWGIPREKFHKLIACESSYNPKARNTSKVEDSVGLSQINLKAHSVTLAQAQDPDFNLDFAGKHWTQRKQMWFNCSIKHSL